LKYGDFLEHLRQRGNEVQGIDLSLDRIAAVMREFGDPQQAFRSLHIAGTNGKGSVAAMAESILRHAGSKTGLYTSPHLVRLEERIRIEGKSIPENSLAAVASNVRRLEGKLFRRGKLSRRLTYFEFVTACAFVHFAREKVDIAVVEVGLGGRFDATNIVLPSACVVTGISYDHQSLLGNTLTEIASEKAGIIKPNTPVALGRQTAEARRVLIRRAREMRAPVLEIDRDCTLEIRDNHLGRYAFDLKTPRRRFSRLVPALAGRHQIRNAALAVAALEIMGEEVPVKTVRQGLARTRWPGRLDVYKTRRRTLLDGAHNAEGARLLRDFLVEQNETGIHLVFGAVRDKDIRAMGRALFPHADTIHLTRMSNSRAADPLEVAALHPRFRRRIRIYDSPAEALERAWAACDPKGVVVVTGSLYLVGEVLPLLEKPARLRPPGCNTGTS
jgi:dihydrofolate synthase / folylpolyglutamate synthase